MRTQKEVFNKLFKEEKTELATQKIELALVDDVNKWEERGKQARSQALKTLNDAIQIYESAIHSHGVALDASEKALNQAKELGADEFIKKMQKNVDFNKGTIKIIEKSVTKLKASRIA